MSDQEIAAMVRQKIADDEASLARYRKLLELLEAEGPVVVPGKGNGTKPGKKKPKEGEKSPRKLKSGGPTLAAERKAKALQLLAEGKTPKEIAKSLGVSEASIYLYRKNAKS